MAVLVVSIIVVLDLRSAISGSEGLQHPKFQTFLYIGSMEYVGGVAASHPNYWAHPQNW